MMTLFEDKVHQDYRQAVRQLRIERQVLAAIPYLGTSKPWAKRWRDRHTSRVRRRIAKLLSEVRQYRQVLGLPPAPPALWKPRPTTAADRRIARVYWDVEATGDIFADSPF